MSRTVLMYAAKGRHDKCLDVLLKNGANVNETSDYYEDTALLIAVRECHQESVIVLLEAGADVNMVDCLLAGVWPPCGCIDVLINWKGADVNTRGGHYDKTPLMRAAENAWDKCVEQTCERRSSCEHRRQ